MKLNHAIKKIAAVGTGAMLLGMSAAAVSADLSDYPQPFVSEDGEFSGTFVLGAEAKAIDVLGGMEIATSLQAAATSPVEGDGEGTESVLSDSVRLATGSSNLYLGQDLNGAKGTLTADDLDMLADVTFEDDSNNDFDAEFRITPPNAPVIWTDDSDLTGDDDPVFAVDFSGNPSEYWDFDVFFPEAIDLDDFQGESLDMLDSTYRFSNDAAEMSRTDGIMTLFRSGTELQLSIGEEETLEIDGQEVTISVEGANENNNPATAQIIVNGELDQIEENQYETVNDVKLYIDDIFVRTIPTDQVVVNFFVGAEKLTLEHGEPVLDGNDDEIDGTEVTFNNLAYGTAWSAADVNNIQVRYMPGEHDEDFTGPVNADHQGLVQGQEYVDPVFDQIKFAFTDVVPSPMSSVKDLIHFSAPNEESIAVSWENYNGHEYDDMVFLYDNGTNTAFAYDDGAEEHYVLGANFDADDADGDQDGTTNPSHVQLFEDNRFIVADGEYTRVLHVNDIDTGDNEIELIDLGTNERKTVSATVAYNQTATGVLDGDATANSTLNGGSFVYDGETEFVIVPGTPASIVLVDDLDTGAAWTPVTQVYTRNGAGLDFAGTLPAGIDWTDGTFTDDETVTLELDEETPYNDDEGAQAGVLDIGVTHTALARTTDDHEYTFDALSTYTGTASYGEIALESDDDIETFITSYGTYAERNSDAESPELEVYYPSEQAYYNVFVGPESATSTAGSSEGDVIGERVNPIPVGSSILDVDAAGLLGTTNLIVIGGPCVNSVASEMYGSPASCDAAIDQMGIAPGEAVLMTQEDSGNTALLVAGFTGEDTLVASRVLANYAQHQADLVGSEVRVAGEQWDAVTITVPTVTEDDAEDEAEE